MFVVLTDEQTLSEHENGLTLQIEHTDVYQANGFYYEVTHFVDSNLFIVKKCLSDTEFDTFVCFQPDDISFGDKSNFIFAFNEDGSFKSELVDDNGVVYTGNLVGVDCISFERPAKISEYQTDDSKPNPFILMFETFNVETGDSFIEYFTGCRVLEKEAQYL